MLLSRPPFAAEKLKGTNNRPSRFPVTVLFRTSNGAREAPRTVGPQCIQIFLWPLLVDHIEYEYNSSLPSDTVASSTRPCPGSGSIVESGLGNMTEKFRLSLKRRPRRV